METVQAASQGDYFKEWLPSVHQYPNGCHGNKKSSKRPVCDDSIYPPKKRALFEHSTKGIGEKTCSSFEKDDENAYFENRDKPEYMSVKIKLDQLENDMRPRSNSLHSNLSATSDNSDSVSSASRDPSPYTVQNIYDHHTPVRNPIAGLKTHVSKPLFLSSDSENSVVEKDQSSYHGRENQSGCHDTETNKSEDEIMGQVDYCKKSSETRHVNSAAGNCGNELDSNFDGSVENMPSKNIYSLAVKKQTGNENYSFHRDNSDTQGCHDDMMKSVTGPMVSLLHRFNAELPVNKDKNQSSYNNLPKQPGSPFEGKMSSPSVELENGSEQCSGVSHDLTKTVQYGNGIIEKQDDGTDVFRCTICNKHIKQKGHFLAHLKSHENQNCKCRICGAELQSLMKLQHHMKTVHKGDNPYKCEHCSREFSQYNNLRRHLRVHRAKIFKCELCDREFNEEFYLTMHMGTHTGKRVYSCGICNTCFSSNHDLKMHVKTHSPSQLHTCDVCGKSFSKACVLRQHKKGHTGDRPHKCEKCPKTFIHRHHLTMHMRSHSDNKPYTCDICNKEFYQSSHLYKHLRCHDDERELIAVTAMKDKLAKTNSVKSTNINAPEVKAISQQISSEKNSSDNSRADKIPFIAQPLRSWSHGQSPKLSAEDTLYSPATMTEAPTHGGQFQDGGHLNQGLLHHPGYYPGSFVPQPLSSPSFPTQNYEQIYMAYAAQIRAYYNRVYMMNYMSQNAMVHPVNPYGQNGGNHMTQFLGNPKLADTRFETNKTKSAEHSQDGDKVDERKNWQLSGTNNNETKMRLESNERRAVDEDERTSAAHELLKMSAGKTEDKLKPNENDDSSSYAVDHGRSFSFTKCINDVIDKSFKGQVTRSAGDAVSSTAQTSSSTTWCYPLQTASIPCVSKGDDPTEVISKGGNPGVKPFAPSSNTTSMFPEEALNLSQKKSVDADIKANQDNHNVQNSTLVGFHRNQTSEIPHHPNYSTHQAFPQYSKPNHTSAASHPLYYPYLNLTGQSRNPMPTVEVTSTNERHSYLKGAKDSPKKHHVLSQDINGLNLGLDLRNNGVVEPSRHISENRDPVFSRTRLDVSDEMKPLHLGEMIMTASVQDGSVSWQTRDSSSREITLSKHDEKDVTPTVHSDVSRHEVTPSREVTPCDTGIDLETCPSDFRKLKSLPVAKEVNEVIDPKGQPENICNMSADDKEEETDDIKALRLKIEEIKGQIQFEKEKNARLKTSNKKSLRTEEQHTGLNNKEKVETKGEESARIDVEYGVTIAINQPMNNKDGQSEKVEAKGEETTRKGVDYFDDSLEERKLEIDLEHCREKVTDDDKGDVDEDMDLSCYKFSNEVIDVSLAKETMQNEIGTDDHFAVAEVDRGERRDINGLTEEFNKDGSEKLTVVENITETCFQGRSDEEFTDKYDIENSSETTDEMNDGADDLMKGESGREYKNCINQLTSVGTEMVQLENDTVDRDMCIEEGTGEVADMELTSDDKLSDKSSTISVIHPQQRTYDDIMSDATLTCGLCWKKFDTKLQMEEHQLDHAREINISNKCQYCDRTFVRSFDLQCHVLKLHSVSELSTSTMPRKDFSGSEPVTPEGDSSSREQWSSEKCAIVVKIAEHMCEFCSNTFWTLEQLETHMNTHKGDKPYTCNVCSRSFAHKHNLNRHKMSHNSKSYECTVCKRTFKETFYLQMHMKIHAEEKNRRCEICGQQVPKSEIWLHTSKHLGHIVDNPTYEQIGHRVREILREQDIKSSGTGSNIALISEQYQRVSLANGSLDQLAKLMELTKDVVNDKSENSENLNIPVNRMENVESRGLKVALKSKNSQNETCLTEILGNQRGKVENSHSLKPLECHICKIVFKTKREFGNHLGIHNGTCVHICKSCGKGFKKKCILRTHEKIHLGEKPYKCADCSATFLHFHHLQIHTRVHNSSTPNQGDNSVLA